VLFTAADQAGEGLADRINQAVAGQIEVFHDPRPEPHADWNSALLNCLGNEHDGSGFLRIRASL
jgi:hypothetical protein